MSDQVMVRFRRSLELIFDAAVSSIFVLIRSLN
jgi:hypothetical protein